MSSPVIDYERLVADFKDGLLRTLRGHAAGEAYLELWVPDEDPIRSLVQMAEAAQAAGRDAISVRLRFATLPGDALPRCEEMLADFGRASFTRQDGSVLIVVSGVQSVRIARPSAPPARARRGARDAAGKVGARSVERREAVAPPASVRRRRSGTIEGMAPCFRDALFALLERPGREGSCAASQGHDMVRVSAEAAVLEVAIARADHRIGEARHRGAANSATRAILEGLCRQLPGMTIQEVADHAVTRLCHWLRDRSTPAPVSGIMLAGNADPEFDVARMLCRALREAYHRDLTDGRSWAPNRFHLSPSPAWLALSPPERAREIARVIEEFDAECGLAPGTTALHGLDDDVLGFPVRAIVALGAAADPAATPQLLRDLARRLMDRVEPTLQVHVTELKDANRLRRLQGERTGAT